MKITINEHSKNTETEIIINCRQKDEHIIRIIAGLNMLGKKITGSHNSKTFIINVSDIMYVETVDRKTFIYTAKQVYETPLKLYELEERLAGEDFIRITKSCVLNFSKVKNLRMDFGGRMICTLENNEKITVSRQYAIAIRQKLDVLKGE